MAHRLVEHVGEVEVDLEAADEKGLFVEAATAFRELVDGARGAKTSLRREVSLGPADTAHLLVDWLNELVFLAEVDAFVPLGVERIDLSAGLRATVSGVRGRPRHLVKAATLNGLETSETGGAWHARVVLDV